MATVNELLKQARAWLGLKESDGSHKQILDVYNSHKPLARGYKVKYTDNWCATFISALAIKCGAADIVPLECSCGQMIELFKNIECWQEDGNITPAPGFIIFYDWDKKDAWPDHVGIVEKVNGTEITVIEGNKNDKVARRVINVGDKTIRGYGMPKYDNLVDLPPKEEPKPVPKDNWTERLDVEIERQGFKTYPIVKKGAKGGITKLIQERLNSVGFSLKCDGIFGNNTEKAVKVFQHNRGLKADGIVGAKTWPYLLSGKKY